MAKRAVLYARVATGDEKVGRNEIDCQLERCRNHAQSRGWEVVAELAEDERGISGHSLDRPKLRCILAMVQTREFDVLIVREPDRLSRSLADLLILREELRCQDIQIEYVRRKRDE